MTSNVKSRPRIGIFTRPIDKGTSGSGHHLLEIVRHILDINEREKSFDIRLIHYLKGTADVYGRAPEIIIPRSPVSAARVLRQWDFDVLHHSPLTVFSPVFGLRARRVATIHSAEPNIIPQYYTRLERAHAKYLKPVYARKMDHIFTVSGTSKAYFAEHWGVNPDRVSVCYNAVSPAYRRIESPLSVPAKYGIRGRYVFHVSKFSHRKNPWCILNAFGELASRETTKDVTLVIAGSGWKNDEVLSFVNERGLADKVVFTGFTPEEDVVELYNGAQAFVFPSRAEGFGMPNVEAMACGCPVVTTRAFAIPEIVGDAAIVVDDPEDFRGVASGLSRILTDPAVRASLVERGLERAASFSWDASARTILGVYASLVR